MNRRTVLKHIGLGSVFGISGCLQSSPGRENAAGNYSLSVVSSDNVASEHQVNISPKLTEPGVTEEHPARVTIETTNRGKSRYFSSMRTGLHFHPEYGGDRSDDPRGLVLREANGDYTREGGRWQFEPHDGGGGGAGLAGVVIEAGETVSNEYLVLDDSTVSGYYASGKYRFEAPVVIRPDAEKGEPSGIVAEFMWGFSLKVEK